MNFIPPRRTQKNDPMNDIMRSQEMIMDMLNNILKQQQQLSETLDTLIKMNKPIDYNHDRKPTGIYTEVGK
jgi:hypothetical protein